MAEICSMPGQSGQNCEGVDEPGVQGIAIIDNKTLSCLFIPATQFPQAI